MNIYAERGSKVVYCYLNSGHEYEAEAAKKILVPGAVYTVETTHVSSSSSDIFLQEFPGRELNCCHFEDVDRARKCSCGAYLVRSRPFWAERFECSLCNKEYIVDGGGAAQDFANWLADNAANRGSK